MQNGLVVTEVNSDVFIQPKDHYVVLNTAHLLQKVRSECAKYGEISAVDFNDPVELDIVMSDIVSSIEYYIGVHTVEHLMKTVNDCLDRAQEYTGYTFTPLQRHLWADVARDILSQTFEYGLRDTRFIFKYVYSQIIGLSLVMRFYNE